MVRIGKIILPTPIIGHQLSANESSVKISPVIPEISLNKQTFFLFYVSTFIRIKKTVLFKLQTDGVDNNIFCVFMRINN